MLLNKFADNPKCNCWSKNHFYADLSTVNHLQVFQKHKSNSSCSDVFENRNRKSFDFETNLFLIKKQVSHR